MPENCTTTCPALDETTQGAKLTVTGNEFSPNGEDCIHGMPVGDEASLSYPCIPVYDPPAGPLPSQINLKDWTDDNPVLVGGAFEIEESPASIPNVLTNSGGSLTVSSAPVVSQPTNAVFVAQRGFIPNPGAESPYFLASEIPDYNADSFIFQGNDYEFSSMEYSTLGARRIVRICDGKESCNIELIKASSGEVEEGEIDITTTCNWCSYAKSVYQSNNVNLWIDTRCLSSYSGRIVSSIIDSSENDRGLTGINSPRLLGLEKYIGIQTSSADNSYLFRANMDRPGYNSTYGGGISFYITTEIPYDTNQTYIPIFRWGNNPSEPSEPIVSLEFNLTDQWRATFRIRGLSTTVVSNPLGLRTFTISNNLGNLPPSGDTGNQFSNSYDVGSSSNRYQSFPMQNVPLTYMGDPVIGDLYVGSYDGSVSADMRIREFIFFSKPSIVFPGGFNPYQSYSLCRISKWEEYSVVPS